MNSKNIREICFSRGTTENILKQDEPHFKTDATSVHFLIRINNITPLIKEVEKGMYHFDHWHDRIVAILLLWKFFTLHLKKSSFPS